jgi:pyruvate/2-oxoglutarate dehydrogenase complex dihydrolipoamide acyltransferase (E2) component
MRLCSKCGAELGDAAGFCSNCGAARAESAQAETFEPAAAEPAAPAPAVAPAPSATTGRIAPHKIENHMVKSIIATACCCPPLGIVGIIYAAQVDALLRQGKRAAAEEAGKKAGIWSNLTIGIGLLAYVLWTTLMIVYQLKERVHF